MRTEQEIRDRIKVQWVLGKDDTPDTRSLHL